MIIVFARARYGYISKMMLSRQIRERGGVSRRRGGRGGGGRARRGGVAGSCEGGGDVEGVWDDMLRA